MPDVREAKVTAEEALGELLLRWQELREQGRCPAPEELCVGRPELDQPL